jgi:hypothetical protein
MLDTEIGPIVGKPPMDFTESVIEAGNLVALDSIPFATSVKLAPPIVTSTKADSTETLTSLAATPLISAMMVAMMLWLTLTLCWSLMELKSTPRIVKDT